MKNDEFVRRGSGVTLAPAAKKLGRDSRGWRRHPLRMALDRVLQRLPGSFSMSLVRRVSVTPDKPPRKLAKRMPAAILVKSPENRDLAFGETVNFHAFRVKFTHNGCRVEREPKAWIVSRWAER